MNILILGDIVGRAGRDAVIPALPKLRAEHKIDFCIINVDNAAHGFGITLPLALEFFAAGADCLTLGNHGFDQKEIMGQIDAEPRLLRGLNYPRGTMGKAVGNYSARDGRKVAVLHPMGLVHMANLDCPFLRCDEELKALTLGGNTAAIIVDFHAEATSEKQALGHYLDGRVSAVVGTHTHVPTADARVLRGGTAYQTDLGMCGDYDSVIGFQKQTPIERFTRKIPTAKLEPASGIGQVRGVVITTDDKTGLAVRIHPVAG